VKTLMRTMLAYSRRRLLAVLTAAGSLAAVAGFLLLASEVSEGDTHAVDRAIMLGMRENGDPSDPFGPFWLEETMRDFTAMGSGAVLIFLAIAACGFLALRRQFFGAWLIMGASTGGILISLVMKNLFDRPRPDFVARGEAMTSSFPSGHSMMAAIVYLTLGFVMAQLTASRRLKGYMIALACLASFLVGLSRVYLGMHFPTDVLAGWAIGFAWAGTCTLLAIWLQARVARVPEA
jgi:undecaprenyl-diphosphatase